MQTILGAGGPVGRELAKALRQYTTEIRLVARNPKKVHQGDILHSADLTHADEVMHAVQGSEVAYLTVGLPYGTRIWERDWPVIMHNVIEACSHHKTKLVYFDNIYMYDPAYLGNMDENTLHNPASRKGRVRAMVADMLLDAVSQGKLEALIARSADFYGPSTQRTGVLNKIVFNNLAAGKAAHWPMDLHKKHSFTYTPDAGIATAMLGNTPDAFNQVWHLPTAAHPFTGNEWIDRAAAAMQVKASRRVLTRGMTRILGLGMPVLREYVEMLYQYDRDYIFRSDKFEKRFQFKPTSYEEGLKEIIASDYGIV